MRSYIEHLTRDPRVKSIFGVGGQSTGWVALCECPDRQEAERLGALARVYGQNDVEIIPLMPADQLRTGLEEAERILGAAPQPFAAGNHGSR